MQRRASVVGAVALLALAGAACEPARLVASPLRSPSPTATPTPAERHPRLRVVATRRGTGSNVFTGELVLDATRRLIFAGEQHDGRDGRVTFRTVVLDADTLVIRRRIGPGFAAAVDPAHGMVFLNDPDQPHVNVVREESDEVIASLPRDDSGNAITVDVSGARLFVGRENAIDVYRLPQLDRVKSFPITAGADALAVDHATHILFVQIGGTVEELDSRSGRPLRTIVAGDMTGGFDAGDGWFSIGQGDWRASRLRVYSTAGAVSWEKHFSRHVGRSIADPSRGLMFDSLDDLTNSEFAAPHDKPDVIEARTFSTGELLDSVRVLDGPTIWGVDPALRRLYITCVLGDAVAIIAY